MDINERDIFNYVYYKDQLPIEKVTFIEQNLDHYFESIEYYKSYQKELDNQVDSKITNKLFSGFSIDKNNIINLYPKPIELPNGDEKLKLAADTVNLTASPVSQTFIDKNSIFMVRFITKKGRTMIYVFSTEDKQIKNIKITLSPSGKVYSMENNLSFLEVEGELSAEGIEMSFEVSE